MNIKKLLISEAEKRKILFQYGILKEDVDPTTSLTIDKNVSFAGGYHSEKYLGAELPAEIEKIKQFLQSKTGSSFLVDVILESGESQIPNTDNEDGGKKVDPLYLANKRNQTIQTYITNQLQSFVDSKLLLNIPKFKISPPKIGATAWVGQPFCPKNLLPSDDTQGYECTKTNFKPGMDANKKPIVNWQSGKKSVYKPTLDLYISEQYIRVKITVAELTKLKQCLDNMSIGVNYTDLSKNHICNSAIYEIYIKGNMNKTNDGILLTSTNGKNYASLNNDFRNAARVNKELESYDSQPTRVGKQRYNTFIVSSDMATELVSDGSTSFYISAKCINPFNNPDWGGGCHKGVGNIVVTNGKGEKTEYTSETPNAKGEIKTLVPIDACGKTPTVKK